MNISVQKSAGGSGAPSAVTSHLYLCLFSAVARKRLGLGWFKLYLLFQHDLRIELIIILKC